LPIRPPTPEDLQQIARRYHFELSDAEAADYATHVAGTLASYEVIDGLEEYDDEHPMPRPTGRDAGRPPQEGESSVNGWSWRCSIKGKPGGSLEGKTVAIKDNTMVAGLPLGIGTHMMDGFIADQDATVVTRLLDAGAEIIGRSAVPAFCFDGGGFVGGFDPPVLNPRDPERIPGGSSSGSAALIGNGEVDMALGGDQGGSIRLPASFSGVVGHKPTFGLVPYTGIVPLEFTMDHVGPMAATVRDCALMLEAIAGPDDMDQRQRDVKVTPYVAPLDEGVAGLRVGLLTEAFGFDVSEPEVDDAVRASVQALAEQGATVQEVSVPMHRLGLDIWNALILQGCLDLVVRGDGIGTNNAGPYPTKLVDFFGEARRSKAELFSPTLRLTLLAAEHVSDEARLHYYAKARNLSLRLRRQYDAALAEVDVLVMPTTAMRAFKRVPDDAPLADVFGTALGNLHNTATFDVTGHPALSVPAPGVEGPPIGCMVVGKHFDDATVLRVGQGIEQQ
jgi:amidase